MNSTSFANARSVFVISVYGTCNELIKKSSTWRAERDAGNINTNYWCNHITPNKCYIILCKNISNRINSYTIYDSNLLDYDSVSVGVHRFLLGSPDGKRLLGRPRRRWEFSIKIGLQEVGWWGIDWTDLALDGDKWRDLVNTVINLRAT